MDESADIAIIGLACRFPGARNADEFWQNLANGVESITSLSDDEILASGVPREQLASPNYVKSAAVLDDPAGFDAAFFGFVPSEARTMDPQHRILLELAHTAFEDAGCDPARYPGRVGVFAGSAMNTYFMHAGLDQQFAQDYIPTLIVNDKDFLATRLSYKLNLKGPSLTVQTACSTSLVAVHLARQSLLSQETDIALAGAVSVRVPHRAGYFADGGGVASPDGHVRAFDASANGTLFGSGAGVVVLKRLSDAIADGDHIRAIIKGSAVNNDGAEKAGYTAPSVNSQADAIVEALANADVEADDISYIEAHGSGTPVGDPIEVRALTKAFRSSTQRSNFCALGSVKTNIGHLDAAAGMAGLIKTTLALQHRQIPASLHYTQSNPEIDFPASPFFVNTKLTPWTSPNTPRRAGIMSTGMGGTNAHVVLEEAPATNDAPTSSQPNLFILSARTETALTTAADNFRAFLEAKPSTNLSDAAFTLQTGRRAMPHRRYVVGSNAAETVATLAAKPKRLTTAHTPEGVKRPVILLLPGVGDQYLGMARELYATFPAFRQEVDRCAEILRPHLGADIRDILFPKHRDWQKSAASPGIDLRKMLAGNVAQPEDEDTRRLNQAVHVQPALFTIEYALARLWIDLGVTPSAIVGHSMGEYVAACLAGVFSLEDALRLIVRRTQLVDGLPPAAMLSVSLPEAELQPVLPQGVSIALINGPSLCVVAGPPAVIEEFTRTLSARDVLFRAVQNTHAFHSRLLDPIVSAFEAEVRKVSLNRPKIPFISNVTGRWATDAETLDPSYWARHLNHTARFSDALRTLWQIENPLLLEVGPGKTLGVLAFQHPDKQASDNAAAISSLRQHYENQPDLDVLLNAAGKLWLAGADLQWDKLAPGQRRARIPLPTYPFERQNFWLAPRAAPAAADSAKLPEKPAALEFDRWFHVPSWERTALVTPLPNTTPAGTHWLIFSDRYGSDHGFRESLARAEARVDFIRLQPRVDGAADADALEEYLQIFRRIKETPCTEIRIVHLGAVDNAIDVSDPAARETAADFGFFSLMHIAQAVGELGISTPIKLAIVSSGLHQVTGDEVLNPSMAPVLGPCGVIPKEFPNITCFNIDLTCTAKSAGPNDEHRQRILAEFAQPAAGEILAYRGRHRWRRKFAPASLAPVAKQTHRPDTRGSDRLRENGIYLITGGTGGIGLSIAHHIAQNCRARFVLTKKGSFPHPSDWRDLEHHRDTTPALARTLHLINQIKDLGSEVEVMSAEATDREAMRGVLAATVKKFGAIHGVIHGAGIVRAGLIQTKSRALAESVLAPKVAGTWILHDLLAGADLDFFVLFSSITAVTAPFAESDYSGANAFLDAFAHFSRMERSYPVISINWPGWKEVGQLANLKPAPGTEAWKEAAIRKAIPTPQGIEAFQRALASDEAQIIVSPNDLDCEIREAALLEDVALAGGVAGPLPPVAPSATPQAPLRGDQLQECVVSVWQQVVGFDQVGLDENFFDLGGHSLLLIQVHRELCRRLGRQISLMALFQHPTPRTLAQYLSTPSTGATASPALDKARLRAERQRQALTARNPLRS